MKKRGDYLIWGPKREVIVPYENILAWDDTQVMLINNFVISINHWIRKINDCESSPFFKEQKNRIYQYWEKERERYIDWLNRKTLGFLQEEGSPNE